MPWDIALHILFTQLFQNCWLLFFQSYISLCLIHPKESHGLRDWLPIAPCLNWIVESMRFYCTQMKTTEMNCTRVYLQYIYRCFTSTKWLCGTWTTPRRIYSVSNLSRETVYWSSTLQCQKTCSEKPSNVTVPWHMRFMICWRTVSDSTIHQSHLYGKVCLKTQSFTEID